MASSKPTAPHCGAFLLPVLHGQRMGVDAGSQPDKAQAVGRLRLELALVFTRQGLAVGAGDRAGAGAALGFNQARPRPWAQIQWGEFPRIPMVQPAMSLPKNR